MTRKVASIRSIGADRRGEVTQALVAAVNFTKTTFADVEAARDEDELIALVGEGFMAHSAAGLAGGA